MALSRNLDIRVNSMIISVTAPGIRLANPKYEVHIGDTIYIGHDLRSSAFR